MFGDEPFWVTVPDEEDAPPVRKGDVVTLPSGRPGRVLATSTLMMRVRPLHWWERLWLWIARRSS